jgi:hypothetical protein
VTTAKILSLVMAMVLLSRLVPAKEWMRRLQSMCNAFSCIITKDKKVFWTLNIDKHDELIVKYKLKDTTSDRETLQFARVEIAPKNNDYLKPNKWVFKIDEHVIPEWFSPAHRQECMKQFRIYKKQLYQIVVKKKSVHPFKDIQFKDKITLEHKLLLQEWDSVWDSVRGSVWDSVRDSVRGSVGGSVKGSIGGSVRGSVRGSVWNSIRDSVRDSVRGSVWDSVKGSIGGYIGSFFRLKRKQWKHTEKIKTKNYPYQSVVDLWMMGLIPSFDGTTWRLHAGKKAKIVFEITKDELMKIKKVD